jgi:hypothetical protein
MSVSSGRTHWLPRSVVLDTTFLRRVIHGDAGYDADLAAFRKMQGLFRFHIGEVSLCEVIFALSENRIKWQDWTQRAPLLQIILDNATPVLHWDCVLQPQSLTPQREACLWRHLVTAKSKEEAFGDFQMVDDFGMPMVAVLTHENVKKTYQGHLDYWRMELKAASNLLNAYRRLPNRTLDQSALFNVIMRRKLPLELHERLDAFGRVWVRYAVLNTENKYNPYAKSHKGDALDFYNLKLLAVPAFLCTADQRLKNVVQAVESWQERWIVTPSELIQMFAGGKGNG